MAEIKVLQRMLPKSIVFYTCKAIGVAPPPMLVTFRDKRGNIRREMVPL